MMAINEEMSFIGLVTSIFLVFNAIGQVPVFLALLAPFDLSHQKKIIVRELVIAFAVLLLFIFCGANILQALGISQAIIGIAGGILLFLISLDLLFPKPTSLQGMPRHEPLIVPLAIPGLAGPGSIAAMMLFASQSGVFITSIALLLAWIPSLALILGASYIKRYLGEKGVMAMERFGGMIICLIGLKMFTEGVIDKVKESFPGT